MAVERVLEAGWLRGLTERSYATGVPAIDLAQDRRAPDSDRPPLAWTQDDHGALLTYAGSCAYGACNGWRISAVP